MNKQSVWCTLVIALFLTFCSNPEKDFLEAGKSNTISSYKFFIEKHPQSQLVDLAIQRLNELILDSLILYRNPESFEDFINTCKNDSLIKIAVTYKNALNYSEDGDRSYHSAFKGKDLYEQFTLFVDGGANYSNSAEIFDDLLHDTSCYLLYKKAAYSYYKATQTIIKIAHEKFETQILSLSSANSFNNYDSIKTSCYNKSVNLFRKANMTSWADFMTSNQVIKDFKMKELEY